MRYSLDLVVGLSIMSVMGFNHLATKIRRPGWRLTYSISTFCMVVYSIIMGFLLWVECTGGYLARYNPGLLQFLQRIFR
jgi:hypothetical protein